MVFGHLVAGVLPMLLELGARAAKGHEPSADLARRVLRTLAEAGGRPFTGHERGHRGCHPGRAGGHRVGVRHRAGVGGRDPTGRRTTSLEPRSCTPAGLTLAAARGSLTRGRRSAYIW